jgi:Ca2+-binding RTX toxin-like protein
MATLVGDEGSNRLTGGDQDDSLDGLGGNDTLEGGGGNDLIFSDSLADSVSGGSGVDTLVLAQSNLSFSVNASNTYWEYWYQDPVNFSDWRAPGVTLSNQLSTNTLITLSAAGLRSGFYNSAENLTGYLSNPAGVLFMSGPEQLGVAESVTLNLPNGVLLSDSAPYGALLIGNPEIGWKPAFEPSELNGLGQTSAGNEEVSTQATSLTQMFGRELPEGTRLFFTYNDADNSNPGVYALSIRAVYVLPSDIENLRYTGTDGISASGNSLNNELTGADGADSFAGGLGDDTLIGGEGSDFLDGGPGKDTASYASASSGVTVSLAPGASNPDALVSIESIVGSVFADSLTGNGVANALDGGTGNDTLVGGDGVDTLRGGSGDDLYTVESLSDRVEELPGDGADTIRSRISYSLQDTDGAAGTLGGQVENLSLLGTAAIKGSGNGLANRITGNNAANLLSGFGGNDTLVGAQGGDSLNGGLGNDSLSGGPGADRLIGGLNNDVLTGGDGEDAFVFSAALGGNVDKIVDFVSGTDGIELDDAIFGAFTAGAAVTAEQLLIRSNGSTANTPDQILIYNQTTGRLYYDADGSQGAVMPQLVAILVGSPSITANDFIIG